MKYKILILLVLGIFLISSVKALSIADPSTIAYWTFNESSGQVAASFDSANQLNISLTNITTGKINNSRFYNFTNAFSENRSLLGVVNANNLSVCGWANISVADQFDSLFAWRDSGVTFNYWTYFSDTNTLSTTPSGGAPQQSFTYTNNFNKWTFICSVLNKTQVSLYINGTLIGSTTHATNVVNAALITIGNDREGNRNRAVNGSIDEVSIFNKSLTAADVLQLYNNYAGLQYPFNQNINVTNINLLAPVNNSYIYPSNNTFYNLTISSSYLPINASMSNCYYNSTWNSNQTAIACNSVNNIILPSNIYGLQTIYLTGQDANLNLVMNQSNIYIEKLYAPTTSFETDSQTFSLELWNETTTPTNFNFTLNGITYTPKLTTIETNRYSLNYTLDIPVAVNPILFSWAFQDSQQQQTPILNFTVNNSLILAQCNNTLSTVYWNITFKNETANQERITSTLIASLNYWLGNGTTFKVLSYINTSENFSYAFCLQPTYETITVNGTLTYSNSISQTRTSTSTQVFTNTTTAQTLYLLPTILGVYSRYVTLTGSGGVLSGVSALVQRIIGGATVTIAQGLSDSSGLFTVFLDPTASYNFQFSKTGYNNNVFSLIPNNNGDYNVYMSSTGTNAQIVNGSSIATNLTISITPKNSTLQNNTIYSFGFNATGNNIVYISANITNSSGQQQGFVNGLNGFISTNINTGNNSFLIGSYQVQTTTENFTFTQTWAIYNNFVGSYSLFQVMTDWNKYGFKYDYFKILIILLTLFGAIGGLSKLEITDTSESKVWTGVFIIWAFSYVGWMTIGLVVDPSSPMYNLSQFANQYGIAIVSTVGSFIVLKEVIT